MKERPILLKPEMVRAIMDGKKTQTRRVVKDPAMCDSLLPDLVTPLCPYGRIGDRLWVRETWSVAEKKFEAGASVRFKADDVKADPLGGRWRPSIHMPRAACRLRLEITDVRLERLQDISEHDAREEGCETGYLGPIDGKPKYTYRMGFFNLWESINGIESLDADPWVWCISFRKLQ